MGSESESHKPASAGTGGEGQEAKPKDEESRKGRFDWGRFLGSVMTAGAVVSVAVVGNQVNATISKAQRETNKLISEAQLKTDQFAVYANRETAVNQLRGQVFSALAQHVVTKLKNEDQRKVALLAALHGNFSKFIDTRPVFAAFLKEVRNKDARHELRRLAKRVARRQADYIVASGGTRHSVAVDWRPTPGVKQAVSAGFKLDDHDMRVIIERVNVKDERPAGDVENTVDVEVTIDEGEKTLFSVSYLDVPYMDNMFVMHKKKVHRVALLLLDMNKTDDGVYHVKFDALHFPDNIIMPSDVPSAQDVQKAIDTPSPAHDHSH